jgi:MerR family copper efflux transcriptional regulator
MSMPARPAPLKIGEVARLADVSVDAVRFYEREGLLGAVRRTAAGQRVYDAEMVRRLAFVKRATALGFALSEVRELVDLRVAARAPCDGVRRRANARLADIDRRLAELQAMRAALVALATTCRGDEAARSCQFLDELARPFGAPAGCGEACGRAEPRGTLAP